MAEPTSPSVSKKDVFAELAKMKAKLVELTPIAQAASANAEAKIVAEREAEEWKRIGSEADAAKNVAEKQLAREATRANEAVRAYEARERQVAELERKLDTSALNAEFDARAREGQVKRSRIIQTELEETRDESARLEERNFELEAINKDLNKTVNNERAMRLQDLHRNSALGSAKKVAELGESEMERRAADISSELAAARAEGQRLAAEVSTCRRVAALHEEEVRSVRSELEEARLTLMEVRGKYLNSVNTLEASLECQRELEVECSRLRFEVVNLAANKPGSISKAVLKPHEASSQRRKAKDPAHLTALLQNSERRGSGGGGGGGGGSSSSNGARQLPTSPSSSSAAAWSQQLALEAAFTGGGGGGGGLGTKRKPLEPGRNWREEGGGAVTTTSFGQDTGNSRSNNYHLTSDQQGAKGGTSLGKAIHESQAPPGIGATATTTKRQSRSAGLGSSVTFAPSVVGKDAEANATGGGGGGCESGMFFASSSNKGQQPQQPQQQQHGNITGSCGGCGGCGGGAGMGLASLGRRRAEAARLLREQPPPPVSGGLARGGGSSGILTGNHTGNRIGNHTGNHTGIGFSRTLPPSSSPSPAAPRHKPTHPGSLYVGSGLGLRKVGEVTSAGRGSSTKHLLEGILAGREERQRDAESRGVLASAGE